MILHLHVPFVLDNPTRKELVVAGMKVVTKPVLIEKRVLEVWIGQNFATVHGRSSAQAAHAAVYESRRTGFNHPHGQSKVGNDFPD